MQHSYIKIIPSAHEGARTVRPTDMRHCSMYSTVYQSVMPMTERAELIGVQLSFPAESSTECNIFDPNDFTVTNNSHSIYLQYIDARNGNGHSFEQLLGWADIHDISLAQAFVAIRYCYGGYNFATRNLKKSNDYAEQALTWLFIKLRDENEFAQYCMAVFFLEGIAVKKDTQEAIRLYQLAADQGLSAAQYALGNFYSNGVHVPKNYEIAFDWYKKAADQGFASAQCCLGNCYDRGEGVSRDVKEAFYYYKKAADKGLSQAQHNLALCYQHGQGTSRNMDQANKYFGMARSNASSSSTACTIS